MGFYTIPNSSPRPVSRFRPENFFLRAHKITHVCSAHLHVTNLTEETRKTRRRPRELSRLGFVRHRKYCCLAESTSLAVSFSVWGGFWLQFAASEAGKSINTVLWCRDVYFFPSSREPRISHRPGNLPGETRLRVIQKLWAVGAKKWE